jgi:hypothetical protein
MTNLFSGPLAIDPEGFPAGQAGIHTNKVGKETVLW